MSDISKIKINDTTYDIKDPIARTDAASAVSAVDNKVTKTGDNMSGDLVNVDHHYYIKKSGANISADTISANQYSVFGIKDVNNELLGYIQSAQYTNGDTSFQISARNKMTGRTNYFDNYLVLYTKKDGTSLVSINHNIAWLNGLGITWGTAGKTAGTTAMTNGNIYLQYE